MRRSKPTGPEPYDFSEVKVDGTLDSAILMKKSPSTKLGKSMLTGGYVSIGHTTMTPKIEYSEDDCAVERKPEVDAVVTKKGGMAWKIKLRMDPGSYMANHAWKYDKTVIGTRKRAERIAKRQINRYEAFKSNGETSFVVSR